LFYAPKFLGVPLEWVKNAGFEDVAYNVIALKAKSIGQKSYAKLCADICF
jgi:hypothetical protein